ALSTTARCQVSQEPGVEVVVPYHDRITEVGAMTLADRGSTGAPAWSGPGSPAIGGIGISTIAGRGGPAVVIVDHNGIAMSPHHALRLGNLGVSPVTRWA